MDSYTLVLTRGTHVVDVTAGAAILDALESGQPTVSVDLDVLCDGLVRRDVRLAMAHVVAVIPNETAVDLDEIPYAENVTALRLRRLAR